MDNTLIRMPDGRLLKQVLGIPMGDPLSPGMCIGTCAWMEAEWLAGMRASTKHFFKAARYMDDILMIMASPRVTGIKSDSYVTSQLRNAIGPRSSSRHVTAMSSSRRNSLRR